MILRLKSTSPSSLWKTRLGSTNLIVFSSVFRWNWISAYQFNFHSLWSPTVSSLSHLNLPAPSIQWISLPRNCLKWAKRGSEESHPRVFDRTWKIFTKWFVCFTRQVKQIIGKETEDYAKWEKKKKKSLPARELSWVYDVGLVCSQAFLSCLSLKLDWSTVNTRKVNTVREEWVETNWLDFPSAFTLWKCWKHDFALVFDGLYGSSSSACCTEERDERQRDVLN